MNFLKLFVTVKFASHYQHVYFYATNIQSKPIFSSSKIFTTEVLAEVKWNTEQIVKEANFEHQLLPYDQLQK